MEWFIIAILYLGIGNAQHSNVSLAYALDNDKVFVLDLLIRTLAWPLFTVTALVEMVSCVVMDPNAAVRPEDQSRLDI